MPAPIDLTGQRFGSLLTVQRIAGGKTQYLCACDCGRQCTVKSVRLRAKEGTPYAVRACEVCRSRQCVVCGEPYLIAGGAATCGADACRIAHRRAKNAEIEAAHPDKKAERQRERRKRLRLDPVKWRAHLEAQAERSRKQRALRDKREARIARREYYWAHRDERREYFRQWEARPENAPRVAEQRRQSEIRYRRRKALQAMLKASAQMIERMGDE